MITETIDTIPPGTAMTHPASAGSLADAAPRPATLPPTRVRRRWRSDGTLTQIVHLEEAVTTIATINREASVTRYPVLLRKPKEIREALLSRETTFTPHQRWEPV